MIHEVELRRLTLALQTRPSRDAKANKSATADRLTPLEHPFFIFYF